MEMLDSIIINADNLRSCNKLALYYALFYLNITT